MKSFLLLVLYLLGGKTSCFTFTGAGTGGEDKIEYIFQYIDYNILNRSVFSIHELCPALYKNEYQVSSGSHLSQHP